MPTRQETVKNSLRGSFYLLKKRCEETDRQIEVVNELKSDLHVQRLRDCLDSARAAMTEIEDHVSKLIVLGEPDGETEGVERSETLKTYDSWEKTYVDLAKRVKDAEVAQASSSRSCGCRGWANGQRWQAS